MNALSHTRKKPEDGSITFPLLQCWNPQTKVATIAAEVSHRRVSCRIALSVLKAKFQARDNEPMKSVTEHREEIENAARKLIENKSFEEDGSILIRQSDI